MKRIKRLSALLAAILIFTLTAPAAAAAEDMVSVRTAEDLLELSRKCMLDSWSQGKIVTLEADVDLTGAEFEPIPTFGGTFRGQDHRITGLSVTGSGNVRGLFRYIQAGATVQDLTVEGTVSPKDRQDDLGLLAGVNYGTVVNCSASGSVSGDNRIGGLVGTNETSGQLISCKFTGSVTGKHSAAGIAGENRGTLARCVNYGSVNTRDLEDAPKTDYTNLQQLNSMENVPVYTDIGGVVGLSDGTVQSCRNEGAVGYEHIGCNIGGVAGRSSGWLDGCVNTGVVLGRKDVGGVVGQLEPEAVQSFSRDFLDKLLDELDRLTDLMDRTTGDADRTADAVSAQLDDLSEKAHSTREIAGGLIDSMTDWTNNNIDQINELSARVSWALDGGCPERSGQSDRRAGKGAQAALFRGGQRRRSGRGVYRRAERASGRGGDPGGRCFPDPAGAGAYSERSHDPERSHTDGGDPRPAGPAHADAESGVRQAGRGLRRYEDRAEGA